MKKTKPIDFRIIVRNHVKYVGQERVSIFGIRFWRDLYETTDILKAMSLNTRILDDTGCNLVSVSEEYNEQLSKACPIPYHKLLEQTKDKKCFYWKF